MQYFNRDLENKSAHPFTLLRANYALKKSLLPVLLEKKGYEIINYGLSNIENHPALVEPAFQYMEIYIINLQTLWGRIRKDIWWHLTSRKPGTNKLPPGTDYINRNRTNYTNFLQELNRESVNPRFVIGHVLLPRRPAYVDRFGHPRQPSMSDFEDKNHDSLYLEQVLYANTLIDSMAKAVTKKHNRPLVLIIEGDHGNRYGDWKPGMREKQFMNLNTYYFSDNDYSLLYNTISPVNSFRVVLNKYFNTGLPLLKDSTIGLYPR